MVTIGIPFFNDKHYLDMAICSIFNQTYTNWRLILIDDGGSDGSLEVAKQYTNDPRITVASDGMNKKLPTRLNELIDLTETKYFARMDADDIMHPERLITQIAILESNPDIDVLGTNTYTIDADNNITGVRQPISNELNNVSGFIHPSVMAKTSWYKENKYDENAAKSQDALLWHSTRQHSVFKATRKPLLFYREVSGSYYKKYWGSSKALFKMLFFSSSYNRIFLFKKSFSASLKGLLYFFLSLSKKEHLLINKRKKGVITSQETERATQLLNISTGKTMISPPPVSG